MNLQPISDAEWLKPHINVAVVNNVRTQKATKPSKKILDRQQATCLLPTPFANHPKMENDDYLHEERFIGLGPTAIWDHNINEKFITYILPASGLQANDTCCIDYAVRNPFDGRVVKFYDVWNWLKVDNKQVFNLNVELNKVFGIEQEQPVTFAIRVEQRQTGIKVDNNHPTATMYMRNFIHSTT